MAVLELAILFERENIYEHKFYNSTAEVKLDESIRDNLMQAVVGLSEQAFNDEVKKFCIANYSILMITDKIGIPGEEEEEKPIRMYAIAENGINEKKVMSCMEDAMFQFLNRFSRYDIMQKDMKKFVEFSERFNKIFSEVIESDFIDEKAVENIENLRKMNSRLDKVRLSSNLDY